jgi:hypothetical protein
MKRIRLQVLLEKQILAKKLATKKKISKVLQEKALTIIPITNSSKKCKP